MADIINLRQQRKRRARADKARAAEAARARSGHGKPERRKQALETQRSERRLDGHRLETPADTEADDR